MSLHPQLKKRWVEALRSGKYKQGRQYLRDQSDQYCCLGVLCDITEKGKWYEAVSVTDRRKPVYRYVPLGRTEGTIAYLPRDIQDKAGLTTSTETTLAKMNDKGWSFKKIADWIEREDI